MIFNNDSTFITDQSIIAEQLMSDIRKYRKEKNINDNIDCDVAGHVKFFENMFDDVIDKEGCVSNKFITNLMSLLCSDDFLNATGRNKDIRHVIMDAYLLAICRTLYSNLELVEMFDSAEKYYC